MGNLQTARAEVCAAYVAASFFYQQANAQYFCARKEDRAAIVIANDKDRAIVEQRIVKAEANLAIAKAKGEQDEL